MLTSPEAIHLAAELIGHVDNDPGTVRTALLDHLRVSNSPARDCVAIILALASIAHTALDQTEPDIHTILDGIRAEATWHALTDPLAAELEGDVDG